jgi:hypothetical protein
MCRDVIDKHVCALASAHGEELAIARAWAEACSGQRCLYFTNRPQDSALRAALPETVRIVPRGAALGEKFEASRMLAWWHHEIAAAKRDGMTVNVCSDLKDSVPHDELAAYEAKLTELLVEERCTALCIYNRAAYSADVIRDAFATHPFVLIDGRLCACPHYMPAAAFLAEDRAREVAHFVERMVADATAREDRRASTRAWLARNERDRARLARALHDDLGQSLAALALRNGAEISDTVGEALETVRALAGDLRPAVLDDLGLVAAVRSLVRRRSLRVRAPLLVVELDDMELDPELASACYRMIESALEVVDRIELRGDRSAVELALHGRIPDALRRDLAERVDLLDGELAADPSALHIRVRR